MVEIDSVSEVEGKNEDTSCIITCIIDMPFSLTGCSGRDCEVEGKNEDTSSSMTCMTYVPLSLTCWDGIEIDNVC